MPTEFSTWCPLKSSVFAFSARIKSIALLANSVFLSFTGLLYFRSRRALSAFPAHHIWSWGTRAYFIFVITTTRARPACLPTRRVRGECTFLALYAAPGCILRTKGWMSRRTFLAGTNGLRRVMCFSFIQRLKCKTKIITDKKFTVTFALITVLNRLKVRTI